MISGDMLAVLCLFFILASARNFHTPDERVYYLQCLLEEKFEPCEIRRDENFSRNISLLSSQIIREFYKLDEEVVRALSSHNFTNLDTEILQTLPAEIVILLPVTHLSMLRKDVMNSIIDQWKTNKIVFKHLIKAVLFSRQLDHLNEKLQSYDFSDENLKSIVEVILQSKVPEAKAIIEKLPLLFHSPPEYILLSHKYEKFYLLSVINKPEADFKSTCSRKCLLRFWAHAMIKNNFPVPLENWIDLYTERWGYVLTGSTIEELKKLNGNCFDDLSELFGFHFSPIQVRLLFDRFYYSKGLYKKKYSKLPNAVSQLLPHQLIKLPYESTFEELVLPSQKSQPTAFQILNIMTAENFENLGNDSYPISKFTYTLSLESFIKLNKQPLSTSQILQIQSKLLTKSQLYILSNGGRIFNFTSPDIFKYSELLKIIPARDIMFNQSASHVLFHLLAYADSSNIPQVFALFNKLWPEISPHPVLEKICINNQSTKILEYLPTQYIFHSLEDSLKALQCDNMKKLPHTVVSSLNYKLKESESVLNLLNLNESFSFLFVGLSCEDVLSLDPYYFSNIMLRFNNYRILSGKIFPKKLQNCCVNKLLELLSLKSALLQGHFTESKLSLLNEAEIDAIGGYIFSALPINAIRNTKNVRAILKSIGSLSSYELLSATTLVQLNKLSSILVQDLNPFEKISSFLFDMGNLTLFMEKNYIKQISEDYFKLLLESDYIEHKLCADSETRSVWYSLLKNSFGHPSSWSYQTLITLSDFLLVVPLSDLDQVSEEAWIYAADVLNTNYFDKFEFDSDKRFFEVCLSHLPNSEREIYITDIRKLVTTLVYAAQLQLDTIVSPRILLERKEHPNSNSVFNFFDSKEEIKISFPPIKTIIGNNSISFEQPYTTNSFTEPTMHVSHTYLQNSSFSLPYYGLRSSTDYPLVTHPREMSSSTSNNNTYDTESSQRVPYRKPFNGTTKNDKDSWHTPIDVSLFTDSRGVVFGSIGNTNTYTTETNHELSYSKPFYGTRKDFHDSSTASADSYSRADVNSNISNKTNYTSESNQEEPHNEESYKTKKNTENPRTTMISFQYSPSEHLSSSVQWTKSEMTNVLGSNKSTMDDEEMLTKTSVKTSEITHLSSLNENSLGFSKSYGILENKNFGSATEALDSTRTSFNTNEFTNHSSLPFHENHLNMLTETHDFTIGTYALGETQITTVNTNKHTASPTAQEMPELTTENNKITTVFVNFGQSEDPLFISQASNSSPIAPASMAVAYTDVYQQNDKTESTTPRISLEMIENTSWGSYENNIYPLHSFSMDTTPSNKNTNEAFYSQITTNSFFTSDTTLSNSEMMSSNIQKAASKNPFSFTSSSFLNSNMTESAQFVTHILDDTNKVMPIVIDHISHSDFPMFKSPLISTVHSNKSPVSASFITEEPNIQYGNYTTLKEATENSIRVPLQQNSIHPLTESIPKSLLDTSQEDNNIYSNISDLLNMNSSRVLTEFFEPNKHKIFGGTSKTYSYISEFELNNSNKRKKNTSVLKKETKRKLPNTKEIKFLPIKNLVEIKPSKEHKKRSIQKWSCDALKMVGRPTEIILDENVINGFNDKDLVNCIDLFAEMDLSKRVQSLIWKRIHLKNIVIGGKLVAACNLTDIVNNNFILDDPWSLEKIFLLTKYNTNGDVRQHLVKEIWKIPNKPFPVELVVSLGSLICELPEINADVISPDVLFKSSVVLGKALPCNFTCLSKLANIAVQKAAFNDPSKWNLSDVHDLGVIIAGLNISGWNKLVLKNHEALSGLSEAAFDCLPYKYIKMMRKVDQNVLPIRISSRLDPVNNKNLLEFNFFRSSNSEVPSFAISLHLFVIEHYFLLFFLLVITNELFY